MKSDVACYSTWGGGCLREMCYTITTQLLKYQKISRYTIQFTRFSASEWSKDKPNVALSRKKKLTQKLQFCRYFGVFLAGCFEEMFLDLYQTLLPLQPIITVP